MNKTKFSVLNFSKPNSKISFPKKTHLITSIPLSNEYNSQDIHYYPHVLSEKNQTEINIEKDLEPEPQLQDEKDLEPEPQLQDEKDLEPEPQLQDEIVETYRNEPNIFCISKLEGGGSIKYLNDITCHYTNSHFVRIKTKMELLNIPKFYPYDILFVQQLLFSDILPEDILKIHKKYGAKIIISIHDFCWFCQDENINNATEKIYQSGYLEQNNHINPQILELFENASIVIHPSEFTIREYSRFFPTHNVFLQRHNDINLDNNTKRVPQIIHNTINIAHFQEFSNYKGSENIFLLKNKFFQYKGYNINFHILGENLNSYTETNWLEIIIKLNFHGLLHLNKFGETFCYSLTKSLNSGLPILYNNIGVFKERISEKEHYFKVIEDETDYYNKELLFNKFEQMLDYIIMNNGLFDYSNNNNKISYHSFYDYLFDPNANPIDIHEKIHQKIKPFAIYFPQFHTIPKNNINFYNEMTDLLNLIYYIKEIKTKDEVLDTPSISELNLESVLHYNLKNKNIIHRQIDIAKKYGICGFAMYYYWFSKNTITNKHTIMESCWNMFFEEKIDNFKIYFVWANEDWTNNPAFNATNYCIINEYTLENFYKNIKYLIPYFKHPNYYKINNKPVFYIHHSYLITDVKLKLFKFILEYECIENGFSGSLLVLNNMILELNNNDFFLYNFHPNYKKSNTVDYIEYTNNFLSKTDKNTDCVFFNFNNSGRLCNPNNLDKRTIYKNTSIYNQNLFTEKIIAKYRGKQKNNDKQENNDEQELNKILLLNAWNEWGENMVIEPGNLFGYKYLSLIKSNLLSFVCF